jgi:hypothetical protein
MKKFLLVVLIGMVATLNLYGCVNELLIDDGMKEVNHIEETTTTVYWE